MAQQEKVVEEEESIITHTTSTLLPSTFSSTHHHQQEREEEKDSKITVSDESGGGGGGAARVLYMLGDITVGPAYRFAQWLDSVRRRSASYRSSGFPSRQLKQETMLSLSGEQIAESVSSQRSEQASETSLWERLGRAAMSDIDSSEFSWDTLSSLHHTEHSSSTEHSEDEMNKALGVTVNSGGVVFFALFNSLVNGDSFPNEAAAVIKISSSRMATQSERLGYEFAKLLGARVVHNSTPEWQQIKDAAERARQVAAAEGDDLAEVTCSELLEALELSRCLFLMKCKQKPFSCDQVNNVTMVMVESGERGIFYVHGSPLLESSSAFETQESALKTAEALGRVLMLDLVIRNEDRLPCRQLGWRGNPANLLLADKVASASMDALEEAFDSANQRFLPGRVGSLQNDRRARANSVDGRLSICNPELISQSSDISELMDSPKSSNMSHSEQVLDESKTSDFNIVAIDSGIPRRPPGGKRANDHVQYPKLVELLLNSAGYSSSLLNDISGGKLGCPLLEEADGRRNYSLSDVTMVVNEFRSGFRAALRDLQRVHIFLLTLYQKLDNLLRMFLTIINKSSSGEFDKEDGNIPESPSTTPVGGGLHCVTPGCKERHNNESNTDTSDSELQRTAPKSSPRAYKESPDSVSLISRENWHGRHSKGSSEPLRSLRLTTKLRDFNKYAKVDTELHRELEQWNEMLRTDAVKLCQENNFNTGFFEGSENNSVVDAYELKVRLEHILERISLISDAANTERPALITRNMFIGGALAARSVYTLQHLNITHVLCLCSNEIGQSDSQYPDLFEYKNFSVFDNHDTRINEIFEEACNFIDSVEQLGGRVLVHCFEGKSRSATVVLAYLMLRKKFTLLDAWNTLKRAHRRAQPNDGFAKILVDLDKKLHGKVSMEWQQRRPAMRVCPICGKNAGLSSSSLKLHLQKSHRKYSSGSVDSAMTMEIHKVLNAMKIREA